MTKRELINRYLGSIGLTLVQGESAEPLLPFLLGDVIYSIYNKDIAKMDLPHKEEIIREHWRMNYDMFNKPFFQAVGAENHTDVTDLMDDIKADIETLHQYEWGRAAGYNANSSEKRAHYMGMTMAEYMRWLWNNPQAGQSPYKLFEGILVPCTEKDEAVTFYRHVIEGFHEKMNEEEEKYEIISAPYCTSDSDLIKYNSQKAMENAIRNKLAMLLGNEIAKRFEPRVLPLGEGKEKYSLTIKAKKI